MKPGSMHQALGTNKRVKLVALALCAMFFAFGSRAEAQQPTKVPRIGFVSGDGDLDRPGTRVEAFRHALRENGYIEGRGSGSAINRRARWRSGTSGDSPGEADEPDASELWRSRANCSSRCGAMWRQGGSLKGRNENWQRRCKRVP